MKMVMIKRVLSFTMAFLLLSFFFSIGFAQNVSSLTSLVEQSPIHQEMMVLTQKAYQNYINNQSIKPLANLMDYLGRSFLFLSPLYQQAYKETLFAINHQQDVQQGFFLSDPKRPKVRPIEDFIAQLCAFILNDYSFSPRYLTHLQQGENHLTKAGTHEDTSLPIPLDYLVDSAKQMYLEAWRYPKKGSLSHYGQIACTGLFSTIAGSYYVQDRQVSTVVKYLYQDAKAFSKEQGLFIEKNHLPPFNKGEQVPVGAAIFDKPAFSSPSHVALCVGEMITYDLTYIANGAIQSAVDHGLSVVDLDSKIVYYANIPQTKTTTLYCYGYISKFEYLPTKSSYQAKSQNK